MKEEKDKAEEVNSNHIMQCPTKIGHTGMIVHN